MPRKKQEAQATPDSPETVRPVPVNRMVTPSMVRVRANRPVGEIDAQGCMQRYKAGDEFVTTDERARALGDIVSRIA